MSSSGESPADPQDGAASSPASDSATKTKRVWLPAAVAVAVVAVVGLVAWLVIAGRPGGSPTASPGASATNSPGASSGAVTGEAVKRVLLDGIELTRMLGQPFTKTAGPPSYGGLDAMDGSAAAGDCAGVVNIALKSVYESADVQTYAGETWIGVEPGDASFKPLSLKVMFVKESVVALPSAAAAQALFAKFADRWEQCDGQAVGQEPATPGAAPPPALPGSEMHIRDVRATDSVLAASIVLDKNPAAPDVRAVGVQGNCIVGVLIPFTGGRDVTGSGDPDESGVEVVHAMMAKVRELS
ncbi:MAG TPA: sensor domain-containing protein [Mycobacterium sp.]|nr:sensor domain-containing protein [Mycobacterium sp.]